MSEEISSNQSPKEDIDRIDAHVNQLSEHYDSVQIFVTRKEEGKDATRGLNRGGGNWFCRYGQIREWVVYEEERIRVCARPAKE